jgi:hypothetical protein
MSPTVSKIREVAMKNNMPERTFVGKLLIKRPLGILKGTNDRIS